MEYKKLNSEKIVNHIVQWLKNYAETAKVKGFVVGISGGIDSALVSTLCAKTGLPTLCVEMPIHQAASQVSRGKEHIAFLKDLYPNVRDTVADLTPTFDLMSDNLPKTENQTLQNLTLANTRARLRMTTLYYFAGINGFLVAGTGNKVEDFGVGFFTKYGDGGVDLSPIADLMKSEVRTLAAYLGITQNIIKAKPTDGLFGDDRSDEDQLGANYDELEAAMHADAAGKTEADLTGRELEVFKIYKRLHTINQHKMNPIPVCEITDEVKF
ncbi:NAD(+) synthase [Flavobacterium sp. CBA20B-1]|uniref:NAD(+) synthase n=1 Tax=unclassified Flavobacterium TaxID=196869 RepID=UPI0022245D8C|nr:MULTISPECIES: NAD(+) synthase [unclassified Flavobacterium]WCM43405.1 NAD(+) synthase [Flavobacterium sp. CBA20B-1]